jgi:hypothetical protein
MATKKVEPTAPKTEEKYPDMDEGGDINDIAMDGIVDDFDLGEEYKPTPLVPQGRYNANVTEVKFDEKDQVIRFTYCLDSNGGVMSDGETPVDGVTLSSGVWLPRPGDEREMTKDGKQTKRQSKINIMKRFADDMKINMDTPKAIITALRNQEWVGISVLLTVGTREYEGRIFNDIKSVKAQ